MRCEVAQSRPDFLGEYAAGPEGKIAINNRDFWDGTEMLANKFRRKRSKHFDFKQTDVFPPGAKFCDHLTRGAGNRSGGDDDYVGIFAVNGFYRTIGSMEN